VKIHSDFDRTHNG